jgi:hypothetical protein
MKYTGSCHCGNVKFQVQGTVDAALACNCSMCQRKGSLLWFTSREKFHVSTPDENAGTYTFNKHAIKHRFCRTCGIHPYAEGLDPKGNAMAAVNLRCLENFELDSVPVTNYDGRSV